MKTFQQLDGVLAERLRFCEPLPEQGLLAGDQTIPITQAKKLIPFDTTHWTGWPTHDNNYIQGTTWWQMTPIILQNIHSTGR